MTEQTEVKGTPFGNGGVAVRPEETAPAVVVEVLTTVAELVTGQQEATPPDLPPKYFDAYGAPDPRLGGVIYQR